LAQGFVALQFSQLWADLVADWTVRRNARVCLLHQTICVPVVCIVLDGRSIVRVADVR
jgi:hypothetical protein